MRLEDFWQTLRETGSYDTPSSEAQTLYTRSLGRLDGMYYADIFHVVVSAYFTALCGRFDRTGWARHAFRMLRATEHAGGRAHLSGFLPLLTTPLPVVYIANHMSMVETLVLPGALLGFGDLVTVVKTSLLSYPLFGRVLRQQDPISVERKDPREDLKVVLTKGEAALRSGRSILIFPQSTRMPEFDPTGFNSLGVKLARSAGVAIIPVAVRTDFQGIGKWIRDAGPVNRRLPIYVRVGPRLPVEGNGRQAHAEALRFITETLQEWNVRIKSPSGIPQREAMNIQYPTGNTQS